MTREERKKVIRVLDDMKVKIDIPKAAVMQNDKNWALDMAIKELEKELKTGHWIDDKCSDCGMGIEDLIDSSEWYRNENPKYCPFCGIKILPY